MKWFLVVLCVIPHSTFAMSPTADVAYSCLSGEAFSKDVKIEAVPSEEVASSERFYRGYSATYLINFKGHDLGYAESKEGDALIFGAHLYPLLGASNLLKHKVFKPSTFKPELAQWSSIEEAGVQYLCVNFNFEGLGRSGSFQNVHGAYLLPTKPSGKLYYLIEDIRTLRGHE